MRIFILFFSCLIFPVVNVVVVVVINNMIIIIIIIIIIVMGYCIENDWAESGEENVGEDNSMENSLDCDNINNYLNTNNQRRLSTYPLDSMALRGGPPDDSDDDDNGSIDNKRDTKIDMPPPPPPNYNTVHGEKFADKRVKVRVLIFVIILSSFVFILFAIFFYFFCNHFLALLTRSSQEGIPQGQVFELYTL